MPSAHPGAAARRALLRDRRRHRLRHRHRLGRAAAPGAPGRPYDRDLRPRSGGALGDAARLDDGARVIALDTGEERLQRAKDFGANLLISPKSTNNVVQAIREATHGRGAHLALDASSSPQARAEAVRCVRTWGKVCFVGEGGEVTLDVSNDLLRRQVTLIGSWTFSTVGQADCARFIADRKIDVDHLFTDRWRLEQAEEAYRRFDTQTTGKGVFLM